MVHLLPLQVLLEVSSLVLGALEVPGDLVDGQVGEVGDSRADAEREQYHQGEQTPRLNAVGLLGKG